MAKIVKECESTINYDVDRDLKYTKNVSASIGFAACELAKTLHAKAIIVATSHGLSARSVSRFRPSTNIVAPTPNKDVYYQLAICWGVNPVMDNLYKDTDSLLYGSKVKAYEHKFVKKGDVIVQTSSTMVGGVGSNLLLVDIV